MVLNVFRFKTTLKTYQYLAFTHFLTAGKNPEEFFCSKEFRKAKTGQVGFDTMDTYSTFVGLSRESCVGICIPNNIKIVWHSKAPLRLSWQPG